MRINHAMDTLGPFLKPVDVLVFVFPAVEAILTTEVLVMEPVHTRRTSIHATFASGDVFLKKVHPICVLEATADLQTDTADVGYGGTLRNHNIETDVPGMWYDQGVWSWKTESSK